MSIERQMDKGTIVFAYRETLLNLKKEVNSATCSNMDGPWRHAKWNKSSYRKRNTEWFHWYETSKIA